MNPVHVQYRFNHHSQLHTQHMSVSNNVTFPPKDFHKRLVECMDMEPVDTEGQLYMLILMIT